jgi:peptide-methionine (S)-S-oxide reductase
VTDEEAIAIGRLKQVSTKEKALKQAGKNPITTELAMAGPYYFAEQYHQQYLAKNPNGYCGMGGTGVSCPVGISGV